MLGAAWGLLSIHQIGRVKILVIIIQIYTKHLAIPKIVKWCRASRVRALRYHRGLPSLLVGFYKGLI